jgi:hypothetical protein
MQISGVRGLSSAEILSRFVVSLVDALMLELEESRIAAIAQ